MFSSTGRPPPAEVSLQYLDVEGGYEAYPLAASAYGMPDPPLVYKDAFVDTDPLDVELNQLVDVVKSLFTMASGVIMPTARTLQTVLYCAEAIHLTWEAWSSGTRIVWAVWYIYMADNTLPSCNSPELPLCLRRMAACMLVTSVAGIVMILPEGRLIEAIGHCAQVARYRALERPDLADEEMKKCVNKVVAAARLAVVGAMSFITAEILHFIFWFIGWCYSFDAGPECGGPMYFAWFNMKPMLPSAFKASVICILLFKHPQMWFKSGLAVFWWQAVRTRLLFYIANQSITISVNALFPFFVKLWQERFLLTMRAALAAA